MVRPSKRTASARSVSRPSSSNEVNEPRAKKTRVTVTSRSERDAAMATNENSARSYSAALSRPQPPKSLPLAQLPVFPAIVPQTQVVAPFTAWTATAECSSAPHPQMPMYQSSLERTPQLDVPTPSDYESNPRFRRAVPFGTRISWLRSGENPIPELDWADSDETFLHMCHTDSANPAYHRDPHALARHPALLPRMRAILIDWLSEVCEVYKLHRESFHLAVDFTDRYLARVTDLPKSRLQLVGVTALWIAAKIEEIYPPKLDDFCYVTDGACSMQQIITMELEILQKLEYTLSPMTCNAWLLCYMQSAARLASPSLGEPASKRRPIASVPSGGHKTSFEFPSFQQHFFVQISELIDLCLMDCGSLRFAPSLLAATACFHLVEPSDVALKVSGYSYEDLASCLDWMSPLAHTVRERGTAQLKHFANIPNDDLHNIQAHTFDIDLYSYAQSMRARPKRLSLTSPAEQQRALHPVGTAPGRLTPTGFASIYPTPPNSDQRCEPSRRIPSSQTQRSALATLCTAAAVVQTGLPSASFYGAGPDVDMQ